MTNIINRTIIAICFILTVLLTSVHGVIDAPPLINGSNSQPVLDNTGLLLEAVDMGGSANSTLDGIPFTAWKPLTSGSVFQGDNLAIKLESGSGASFRYYNLNTSGPAVWPTEAYVSNSDQNLKVTITGLDGSQSYRLQFMNYEPRSNILFDEGLITLADNTGAQVGIDYNFGGGNMTFALLTATISGATGITCTISSDPNGKAPQVTGLVIHQLGASSAPIPALNPEPENQAVMTSINTSLKWTWHSSSSYQRVYFGTESDNLTLIDERPLNGGGTGGGTPAAHAVFWLDAAKSDTIVKDAEQKVSRWYDATDSGNYAEQTISDKQPLYAADSLNGNAIVDFGPALANNTGPWLQFKNAAGTNLNINTIRTVFWVLKGGNFLLGDDNSYHFHRGDPYVSSTAPIWSGAYANASIRNGVTCLNGQVVNGVSTALPDTYSVISVVTTGNVEASNLCNDRNQYRSGGQQVAEVIIYDRVLTEQERLDTESYLSFKWFGGAYQTAEIMPNPTPLAFDTRYYWRVDLSRGDQTAIGKEWSFQTELAPVSAEELGFDEIIFIKRRPYSSDHYYTVIDNGTNSSLFQPENGIYIFNLRTRQERPVITAAQIPGSGKGVPGKFTLSFDATKVIFDYRDHAGDGFKIWECNVDGTGLRQILAQPEDEAEKIYRWNRSSNYHIDDIDPAYLPDGDIIFSSNRCEHTVLCGGSAHLSSPALYRMDPQGQNLEQLSKSLVCEFSPVVMDDGRVMYHRWEYIDKGARVGKTIWSMNPDGSKSQELFGLSDSNLNTGAHMFAQQMPGNDNRIVFVTGPHFPQGNCVGPIQIADLNKDTRTSAPLTNITPNVSMKNTEAGWFFSYDNFSAQHQDGVGGPLYNHPYPVNPEQILVSYKHDWNAHYRNVPGAYAIYLIDLQGNHRYVYQDPDGTVSCWHPTPLRPRKTPPAIFSFRHPVYQAQNQAQCIVINVYEGLDNIQSGEVKWLRINEAIPRYWDTGRRWSPSVSSSGWVSALWPRVQWGVVPVETDGSANFMVPANRNIFFQALDKDFREIQRERTFVNYRAGEIRSCVGCHERSGRTPSSIGTETPIAMTRAPSKLQPQPCDLTENGGDGRPEQVIHYPTDIQPIFNNKCVSCHGGDSPSGSLDLSDTLTLYYNNSYQQLTSKSLAGKVIAEFIQIQGGDRGNENGAYLPPKSLGCYGPQNKLLPIMLTDDPDNPHHNLLTDMELMRLCRWMDTNYQFYGTYYSKHHYSWASDPNFRRRPTFGEAISMFAPEWHK